MSREERKPLLLRSNQPKQDKTIDSHFLKIKDDNISMILDFLGIDILQFSRLSKKYNKLCMVSLNVLSLAHMLNSMSLSQYSDTAEFNGPNDFKFTLDVVESDFAVIKEIFSASRSESQPLVELYKITHRLLMLNVRSRDEKYLSEDETSEKRAERMAQENAIEKILKNISTFYDKNPDTRLRAIKMFAYNACCCLPIHLIGCGVASGAVGVGIFLVTAFFFAFIIVKLFGAKIGSDAMLEIAAACSALGVLIMTGIAIHLYVKNTKENIQINHRETVFRSLRFMHFACDQMKKQSTFVAPITSAPRQ